MKKIVMLLAVAMFAGVSAEAADVLTDSVAVVKDTVVANTEATANGTAETVTTDVVETVEAEEDNITDNLESQRAQLIDAVMDIDKKIKAAEDKNDSKSVDELTAEKKKLFISLDKVDADLAKAKVKAEIEAAIEK